MSALSRSLARSLYQGIEVRCNSRRNSAVHFVGCLEGFVRSSARSYIITREFRGSQP
jgi:hypothetical protein